MNDIETKKIFVLLQLSGKLFLELVNLCNAIMVMKDGQETGCVTCKNTS